VQFVGGRNTVLRVEVKPTTSALILVPSIPRDRKRLYSPIGEFNQILLEGVNTEGVSHFEVRENPIRAIGSNHELAIAAKEGRRRAKMRNGGIVKIAKYRDFAYFLHGEGVLRPLPCGELLLVTGSALGRPHELWGRPSRIHPISKRKEKSF
jgi:hypothetical protein